MVSANYYDMPAHMKHRNKMAERKRKAKEEEEKAANLCPLCVRRSRSRDLSVSHRGPLAGLHLLRAH